MTTPTPPSPIDLDRAVLDAMKALAVAQRADPEDPAAVSAARQTLMDARKARGYV